MSSPRGTGSDITPRDAADLLQKFSSESTKLQAVFATGFASAFVVGFIKGTPDGRLCVAEREEVATPMIIFDARLATGFKYGDRRAFPNVALPPGSPAIRSALVMIFPDTSQLSLFELS